MCLASLEMLKQAILLYSLPQEFQHAQMLTRRYIQIILIWFHFLNCCVNRIKAIGVADFSDTVILTVSITFHM